jgi:hypothetical protein
MHLLRLQGSIGVKGIASSHEEVHLLTQEKQRFRKVGVAKRSKDVPAANEPIAIVERVEVAARRPYVVKEPNIRGVDDVTTLHLTAQAYVHIVHNHLELFVHAPEVLPKGTLNHLHGARDGRDVARGE